MVRVHVRLSFNQPAEPNEVLVIWVAVAEDEWLPRSGACRLRAILDRLQLDIGQTGAPSWSPTVCAICRNRTDRVGPCPSPANGRTSRGGSDGRWPASSQHGVPALNDFFSSNLSTSQVISRAVASQELTAPGLAATTSSLPSHCAGSPADSRLWAKPKSDQFSLQVAQDQLNKDDPGDYGKSTATANSGRTFAPTTQHVDCGALPVGPRAAGGRLRWAALKTCPE
jgi:hypothetical protein